MKKLVLGIMSLALFSSAFALDATDIEAKIAEIQNLPASERVEKMNELKMEIKELNENEREKIIQTIAAQREKMEQNKETVQEHTQEMMGKMEHVKGMEHEMPEMEHDTPETEHEMPELEHEIPEIDHDIEVPEIDHETTDTEVEHDTTETK